MPKIAFSPEHRKECIPQAKLPKEIQDIINNLGEKLSTLSSKECALISQKEIIGSIKGLKESISVPIVLISEIKEEAATKNHLEEHVVVSNVGCTAADITGWRINAGADGQDYIFPADSTLEPGESTRIYTLRKSDNSFRSKVPLWNNRGDRGLLFNREGEQACSFAYGAAAAEHIVITAICYDGDELRTESDEYIEITNTGPDIADISDWRVDAGAGKAFIFPHGTLLLPGRSVKIYTNQCHEESGGFSFNSHTAIWNNKGDTGYLYDNKNNVVSNLRY